MSKTQAPVKDDSKTSQQTGNPLDIIEKKEEKITQEIEKAQKDANEKIEKFEKDLSTKKEEMIEKKRADAKGKLIQHKEEGTKKYKEKLKEIRTKNTQLRNNSEKRLPKGEDFIVAEFLKASH